MCFEKHSFWAGFESPRVVWLRCMHCLGVLDCTVMIMAFNCMTRHFQFCSSKNAWQHLCYCQSLQIKWTNHSEGNALAWILVAPTRAHIPYCAWLSCSLLQKITLLQSHICWWCQHHQLRYVVPTHVRMMLICVLSCLSLLVPSGYCNPGLWKYLHSYTSAYS